MKILFQFPSLSYPFLSIFFLKNIFDVSLMLIISAFSSSPACSMDITEACITLKAK